MENTAVLETKNYPHNQEKKVDDHRGMRGDILLSLKLMNDTHAFPPKEVIL
ncbi:MAG: hypothetical protein M1461_07960 [Nitrospirae bacterium]|nr:hypothetical protein [Nitrospirota bacterium]